MEIVSSFVKMGFLRFWQFNWLMRLGQKMTCSVCEARREWIRQRKEIARLKLQLLLQRLGSGNAKKSTYVDESNEQSK